MTRFARWARQHGETVVFTLALAMLLVLGMWWTRLLTETVEIEAEAARATLAFELLRAAGEPTLRDERMIVVPQSAASVVAAPLGDYALDARPEVLAAMHAHAASRRWMVQGESGTLLVLLSVCIVMLYRLFTTQRAVQREMSFFVGQMTHEMKTPLAGLRALLETLQRGRVDPEDLPDLITLGLQQIDREEHLVQTLLQAQRLRVTTTPLPRQPMALSDVLERFRSHRAHTPGAAIEVDADGVVARGDPDAVWTILENLVDNANKYEARTIRLSARAEGGRARIACADDGAGFRPDRRSALFQPFRSAHSDSGPKHGTGLGLYLSRRLARALGGDLEGDSEGEGKGARFVLTLPLEPPRLRGAS